MKLLTPLQILRCFIIAVLSLILLFFLLIGTVIVFEIIPSLEAPFQLVFQPEKLGRQIGEITVSWDGQNKPFKVYIGKRHYLYQFRSLKIGKCLLLYPKYSFGVSPFEHAFKVTENTIEIFDDTLFSCLPMGSYIYESDRAIPGHPVDDDMSGWDTPFKIIKAAENIFYSIPAKKIHFTVPLKFFDSLKK